jgi:phospholipase C
VRVFPKCLFVLLCLATMGTMAAQAQNSFPTQFKHVIVIFQENRTPDNLFRGLLTWPGINPANYNIATFGINSKGEMIPLQPVPLGIPYDLDHSHTAFVSQYDKGKLDGADLVRCSGQCTQENPQFKYVDNSDHSLDPYLTLAADYGWANAMHQTNQGPSFPAHQFIFGGSSARTASDDQMGRFVSENPGAPKGAGYNAGGNTGCLAPLNQWNWVIDPSGVETKLINNHLGTLCFERDTMSTLLDARGLSWKYYAPAASNPGGANPGGSIWNAPNSIRAVCKPNQNFTECMGSQYATNVDLNPSDVLTDIRDCHLANVSWVIPDGKNSDHAGSTATTGGPSWVASIVNAVGTDNTCEQGAGYWSDTAIVITWDDWGGWYDHVLPPVPSNPQGDYQYGFRVPLIVASAYTPQAYVNNIQHDFGSILKFIEATFDIPVGSLGFADERATGDLSLFFDFTQAPRKFEIINTQLDADFFINDKRPPEPPDND